MPKAKKRPLPKKIIAKQERRIRAQLDAETLVAAKEIEGNKRRAAAAKTEVKRMEKADGQKPSK